MNSERVIIRTTDVTRYIAQKLLDGSICVTKTVDCETVRNMRGVLSDTAAKHSFPASVMLKLDQMSFVKYGELASKYMRPDDPSLLWKVRNTYAAIWSDPAQDQKKKRWATIKKTTVENGPPSGADLKILATAAKLAQGQDVELLTFDNDFILFADEIYDQCGVFIK